LAIGAQHPVVEPVWPDDPHSVAVEHRHCCPVTDPGAWQAPPWPPPARLTTVQHPLATGQSLLVVQVCAHSFVPVGVVTHVAVAFTQHWPAHAVSPVGHCIPPELDPELLPPELLPLDELPDELDALLSVVPPSFPPPPLEDDEHATASTTKPSALILRMVCLLPDRRPYHGRRANLSVYRGRPDGRACGPWVHVRLWIGNSSRRP
jgi:hypothetical protein